jgi:hypothetical protein
LENIALIKKEKKKKRKLETSRSSGMVDKKIEIK